MATNSVSRAASERGMSAQSKVPFYKKANTGKMAELGGFTAILHLVATLPRTTMAALTASNIRTLGGCIRRAGSAAGNV
jgi:hypothetical protein